MKNPSPSLLKINRSLILSLYRQMLRESKKFDSYIYRQYALRRTREAFRDNQHETNEQRIKQLIKEAQENLMIIRRQTMIGQLYPSRRLVVEDPNFPRQENSQDDPKKDFEHRKNFVNHRKKKDDNKSYDSN